MKISFTLFVLMLSAAVCAQPNNLRQSELQLPGLNGIAKINTLNELAWGYRRLEPQKAQTFAEQAEQLSMHEQYASGLAFAHKNLGFLHNQHGEIEVAEQYLMRSRREFQQLNNRMQEGNLENLLGLNYWEKSDYPAAIRHYKLADSIFTVINDSEGNEIVLANLGIIYYERASYDTALTYYTKALKKVLVRNNPLTLSDLYTNIGLVYHEMGNFPKAISYHQLALAIDIREKNIVGQAKSFTNLSECYFGLRQYDQALDYTRRGLKLHEQTGEAKGMERSNLNVAHIELRMGNIPGAKAAVQDALRTGAEIGDKRGILMGLALLGSIQIDAGEYAAAIVNLNKAAEMADVQQSVKYQSAIALLLAKTYEKLGDAGQAISWYRRFTTYNAKLSETRAENQLAELEIFLETRSLKNKIDKLQTANASSVLKKKIAVGAGIVLTVLAALIYFSQQAKYRRRQNRSQIQLVQERSRRKALARNISEIERESEASKAELRQFIRAVLEKQEQSFASENGIERPAQATDPEELEHLKNSRILTEEDWQEFRKRFDKVFPDSLAMLKKQFPAITTAELRLVALLQLKLSSRQISLMLGISAESVKKLRQRLRKKLSLPASEKLESYLDAISQQH